uniref:Uncharacterized protein n=1 Tax=Globodera rostochiensis TaxID=31243 RepID=A0A914I5U9_GLORO
MISSRPRKESKSKKFIRISSNNNKRVHHQQMARVPSRALRQSALQYPTVYYICGEFPNLAYQLTPCQRCRNGGRALYAQCTTAVQCTPYYRGPTECIEVYINYPDGSAGFFDPYQNGAQGGYVGEQSEGRLSARVSLPKRFLLCLVRHSDVPEWTTTAQLSDRLQLLAGRHLLQKHDYLTSIESSFYCNSKKDLGLK